MSRIKGDHMDHEMYFRGAQLAGARQALDKVIAVLVKYREDLEKQITEIKGGDHHVKKPAES